MTDAKPKRGIEQTPTPAPIDVDQLRGRLDQFMNDSGFRSTSQRRLIIESFFEEPEHASLNELLAKVRRVDAAIGYATVYRTMRMLVEAGIAQEHKFGDGFTRYELSADEAHHDHLICMRCGRIQEFEEPLIEELQVRVAARLGFRLVDHKHELYGVCCPDADADASDTQSGNPVDCRDTSNT